MLKRVQIIVYTMLIQAYFVAHAEDFLESLFSIIGFQFFDLSDIFKRIFDVDESETIDIHFKALGYETSDSILNLGPIFASLLLLPGLITIVFISSRCCCYARLKNFFKKKIE